MDLFLLHFILLSWLSVGAAARWVQSPLERVLTSVALGWANLVATALVLSVFHRLGHPVAFLGVSLGFATGVLLWAWKCPTPIESLPRETAADLWLSAPVSVTLGALAGASAWAAAHYMPSTPAALAYELPRSLLQIGNGSIFPLPAGDARQVLLPFNHGLLHTWALVYRTPLQILNFFNLFSWCLAGVATYRFGRVLGWGANASLVAAWCALVTTTVLAQAATSESGLPAATALVGSLSFLLDWRKTQRLTSAAFGGLLAGLAAGTSVGALLLVFCLGLGAWLTSALPSGHRRLAVAGFAFGILPFAANLTGSIGHGLGTLFATLLRTRPDDSFLTANILLPLWQKPDVLHGPTEETVGLGLPGLLCLIAGIACTFGRRHCGRPTFLFATYACGWAVLLAVAAHWFAVGADQLILSVFLAVPAVAALVQRAHRTGRVSLGIGIFVAACGLWSAGLYLGHNARRALVPLIDPTLAAAPRASPVPGLLDYRLSAESRVNFMSDGEDNLLLVLMARQQTQRYTALNEIAPDAYNVISRSSLSRNRPLGELRQGPAYILIPFDEKPTAGVEFLGSVGLGSVARDYLGISVGANDLKPIVTNHTVLLSVAGTAFSSAMMTLKATLVGLNPRDDARVEIYGTTSGGERARLAQLDEQGEHLFSAPTDLQQIVAQITSKADGRQLGSAVLDNSRTVDATASASPASAKSLFRIQLVSTPPGEPISVSPGLTAPEGPFPQWNLPLIRWARAETITLRIPPAANLDQIRLSFSVRLHLRAKAAMEVSGNGRKLREISFDDPVTWHEVTLMFPASAGENVIEFRDAEMAPEPDWAGYLERYPDVKRYVETMRQRPKEGALEHYKYSGKGEGRLMDFHPVPRPAADAYFFMFRSLVVEGLPR